MRDVSLLLLRMVVGGLLAGHGAQKLFGAFDGPGLHKAGGMMESLGMQPGHRWATMAGLSEFGGGLLTALGFLGSIGPIASMGSMFMAATTAHWGKPIWVTHGGAELPVTNMAVLGSLAMAGPGRVSMDRLFGVRIPWWMTGIALMATIGGIVQAHMTRQTTLSTRQEPAPQPSSATNAQADVLERSELPHAA